MLKIKNIIPKSKYTKSSSILRYIGSILSPYSIPLVINKPRAVLTVTNQYHAPIIIDALIPKSHYFVGIIYIKAHLENYNVFWFNIFPARPVAFAHIVLGIIINA